MHVTTLEREQSDPRTQLTAPQIAALCENAFGAAEIERVTELDGGEFNSTFLVEFPDGGRASLRVGPPAQESCPPSAFWNPADGLRRAYAVQPYLSALAHLTPRILFADFTRRLLARDYMFQSWIDGKRWLDHEDELADEESDALWHDFGRILKQLHATLGDKFGPPPPGKQYDTWSEYLLAQFEGNLADLAQAQLNRADVAAVYESAQAHRSILDEIRIPSLLHGDLWTFNLLIRRNPQGVAICGVLDAEYAWWGDPPADWTMFIWTYGDGKELQREQSRFWAGYGLRDKSPNARFRDALYHAMHLGRLMLLSHKDGSEEGVARAQRELRQARASMQAVIA
jgi:aminoglycoside phosphotransferase (APT) family kinase protein